MKGRQYNVSYNGRYHRIADSVSTLRKITCVLGAVFVLASCGSDSDGASEPTVTEQDSINTAEPGSEGTIAATPEALAEFLTSIDDFSGPDGRTLEIWLCEFSDGSADEYIRLEAGDPADPEFSVLQLIGNTRTPQLNGDPRPLTADEMEANVPLTSARLFLDVTSSDSAMLVYLLSDENETRRITFDWTTIRLGPGRSFRTDESTENLELTCTTRNIPRSGRFY